MEEFEIQWNCAKCPELHVIKMSGAVGVAVPLVFSNIVENDNITPSVYVTNNEGRRDISVKVAIAAVELILTENI